MRVFWFGVGWSVTNIIYEQYRHQRWKKQSLDHKVLQK